MVGKMKSGQLDAAAVTAVGLSRIYKPVLALQIPGLLTTWVKLDAARDALKGDFEKGMADAGFSLFGWCDVGATHLMSKGFAVQVPDDLKGKKPFKWRDNALDDAFFPAVGGVTAVPLNIPEVLPNLNTGAINIVLAPALAAEQLQWSGKLDHIGAENLSMAIGALVISSKKLEALSEDHRAILRDTGRVAASALTKKIRSEVGAAFGRLKGKMTVVTQSPGDKTKWQAVYKATREKLGAGTLSPDLITKLEGLAK